MARLFLSGVATRAREHQELVPESVLALFGCAAAGDFWSGLYGTSSTREGLKRLLQTAKQPQSIFRVVCEVAGGIVTSMGEADLAELGYLNVRYADAPLLAKIERLWCRLAELNDPQEAINTRPDLAPRIAASLNVNALSLIIHPFQPPYSDIILNAATILDPACIQEIHSRDPNLQIAWNGPAG